MAINKNMMTEAMQNNKNKRIYDMTGEDQKKTSVCVFTRCITELKG